MHNQLRTLGYLCPKCHQPVIVNRSVFSLCAARSEVKCPCGGSTLELDPGEADITLTVPCSACTTPHRVTVPQRAFLHQRALALSCQSSGLDCCYVGEEGAVFAAMERLEQAMDLRPQEEPESVQQFLNPTVMLECLQELRDIAARDSIRCRCDSRKWGLKIHYASLSLTCSDCGRRLRLPAATQEDLTDLCCKGTLEI